MELSEAARKLKTDLEPRVSQKDKRRVALSAKPLNTDSNISLGSPSRINNRKRSSIGAQRHSGDAEVKKSRVQSPVGLFGSAIERNDEEQTDEDEEQQYTNDTSKRLSQSKIHAQRAESHHKIVFPRFKLSEMPDLEVDLPSTYEIPSLPDDADNLLEGFDFSRPRRLQNLLYSPKFITEVEANSKVTLDDFPDLDYSDADSDSLSTIGLDTPGSALHFR